MFDVIVFWDQSLWVLRQISLDAQQYWTVYTSGAQSAVRVQPVTEGKQIHYTFLLYLKVSLMLHIDGITAFMFTAWRPSELETSYSKSAATCRHGCVWYSYYTLKARIASPPAHWALFRQGRVMACNLTYDSTVQFGSHLIHTFLNHCFYVHFGKYKTIFTNKCNVY